MTRFIPKISKLKPAVERWLPSRTNPTFTRSHTPRVLLDAGQMREEKAFGSNPGKLRMFNYIPATLTRNAPLVVALHGCGQSAVEFNSGTGWSQLADDNGFALLLPQQRRINNPTMCFNWYDADHARREAGEAHSLFQMIEHMLDAHNLDRKHVYITGLSAGGAMSAAMLAAYPELFAAGATIAGLPFGAAGSVSQAIAAMGSGVNRTAPEWGELVRTASPHSGPWPRLSIWHGAEDRTVAPANITALERQWCNVHALPCESVSETADDDLTHRIWRDSKGTPVVESILIRGMDHGAPIDVMGKSGEPCGAPSPFMYDVGISSSRNVAQFWGLTKGSSRGWLS